VHKEIQSKFNRIVSHLDEKSRRLWCANEAITIGWGGVTTVSKATGISRNTISEGVKEIEGKKEIVKNRIRKQGAGRKKKTESNPGIREKLESLIEPYTRGEPESPLRWVCKSTRNLEKEMRKSDSDVSHNLIARELNNMGYSLQANKKTKEGSSHPDRNDQFHFINNKAKRFIKENQPVVSVDTKKKENIGNYKNNGKEYCKKGKPKKVKTHDFPDKKLGKAAPYGVYDLSKNNGWVNVGISKDTAQFSVNSIRKWYHKMGKKSYPKAKKLLITADCGGSNGYRNKLWKVELQKLSDKLQIEIHVSHFPPGTSKWNKIEHRMFSFITKNWRGKPLVDRATIINLIANTTTKKGLKIKAELDENTYETGIKISEEELAQINIYQYKFHGEWNYKISPKN
jgi:DNA-binding transcriptional regulator GbsR (MarR family)